MANRIKTFAKIFVSVICIVLIVFAVFFVYRYTNGFDEDFKTFYVENNGERFLTERSKKEFNRLLIERFDVKYTFGNNVSQKRDYSVKIIPNVVKDFMFEVDGLMYRYSRVSDLSAGFSLNKQPTYFEFSTSTYVMNDILDRIYDSHVVLVNYSEIDNPYPFSLIVSSYNERVNYRIDFAIFPFSLDLSHDTIIF